MPGHAQHVRHAAETERQSLEAARLKNDEALRFHTALHDLGVDLTQYLCVTSCKPPDHIIKLDGAGLPAGSAPPALHLEVPQPRRA